jgi:hypothetical protein
MATEPQLRETSDLMLAKLAHLAELEGRKRQLEPGSDEFVEMAREVEALALELLGTTQAQTQLAGETKRLADAGAADRPTTPIAEVEPTRDPTLILAEWREAERQLGELEPGSPLIEQLRSQIEGFRAEYRRAFEQRR